MSEIGKTGPWSQELPRTVGKQTVPSPHHLAGEVELLQDLLELGVIAAVEIQLAKFRVGFEPESVVFGVLQCLQSRLVKVLQ